MITTYQIRNVLRIYGNQLKKRTTLFQDSVNPIKQTSDSVDISVEARRKQMLNKMSNNIISQITQKEYPYKIDENLSSDNTQTNQE